ncbi:MAG: hypothetical protein COZ07_04015 [Candidatus Infernicultor aquiphilus]|uniref:Type I restriction modification DNA specificity domain-containing protein n=1 Tax=Candidatus Infernicultor aquiphilus TaxID=1805029 RepID=A0A1J5GFB4_9BACT|nr:hypothetical protein [bacterium]OIP71469.1 MAG: hypothetical protein AUK42_03440 [Candidatus Atribacteria bacterium CG2_30_33_13]PIU25770.1 MAG: hypothetical protein COT11_00970 [Candidatus Atribacteria bacterium CG08_land_8_20_14_0_20_33_29]PIW11409.1 MAG: hypothetical protein COW35_07135 [Candidatus Atribacteria bacterium CG17_big_fil_post_rev_8_21_14_2_50_34_11]PIX33778.1 MAG: hypothetical protein COZ58_06315 [Candidatus Atribacteria bacterium CG_4_8_14_3_um_filter_34_18]PIY32924.1 MAG: 
MFNYSKNWELSKIGECLMLIRGISFPKSAKNIDYKDGLIACLRTKNVQKEVDWNDLWFVDSIFLKRKEQIIKKGDILISVSNSLKLLGKVSLIKSIPYVSTLGAFIVNLRVSELLNNKFIFYYLSSLDFKNNVKEKASTTTNISNISAGKLANIFLPIAPLNEQNRIVEKIEALFSDLDKATEDLKKTQEQLKIYRQAVLKAAFEGKLTNGNRNWVYKKFKECLKFSQGIQIDGHLQDEKKEQNKIRFLRIIDFTQGNELARYINKPSSKYIVNKEDVSLVRYGATTGFVCSGLEGAIANNLFKVIPDETISKKYLLYFLNSPFFQQIISIKVKGAAMPAISFGLINDFVLPIPLLKEQSDIVREIESRLSVCDKVEKIVEQNLSKIEYLRQSILKKAFEGKLVSQDPNDLPACELLKQIKIKKDKMSKNGK